MMTTGTGCPALSPESRANPPDLCAIPRFPGKEGSPGLVNACVATRMPPGVRALAGSKLDGQELYPLRKCLSGGFDYTPTLAGT